MKELTDVVVREMKCAWKSEFSKAEKMAIKKAGLYLPKVMKCAYCAGHNTECDNYIRRVIHYLPGS